ncbi:hypothetical protein, partial [Arthrobacter sp. DR-2P]
CSTLACSTLVRRLLVRQRRSLFDPEAKGSTCAFASGNHGANHQQAYESCAERWGIRG